MDFEDLSEEQIEELAERLEALRDELVEQLEEARTGSKPVELDQARIGRLSRADAMQQQQMAAARQRRIERRLNQVKSALGKMERDEYGYCAICDEPLSWKRLSARPESPICVRCQTERER